MSELLLVVLSLVLLLQPNQPPQPELPLPLLRMKMSETLMMMPNVANDDDAGAGGVDNSVAPLASSSFTDDLLIRRAELLRQQHSE